LKGNNPTLYAYVKDVNNWIDSLGLQNCRDVKPRIEDGNLREGWKHIDARHITGNHPRGAGDLFRTGTSRRQLQQAANKVVKGGHRKTVDSLRRIQTFERKIVVNGKKDLVRVTIDTHEQNKVITMFPVRGSGHH